MKTFAYYIGMFVIVAVMFAFPILATLSFCFDWDLCLKFLFTSTTAVDFALVMLVISWCIKDFNDN